jgi:hypothetical protein
MPAPQHERTNDVILVEHFPAWHKSRMDLANLRNRRTLRAHNAGTTTPVGARKAVLDVPVEHTTAAALEEKAKLRKHFGRFDIFFFLICTIVGLDTLGSVASYGAQAFVWLIFLGVFFFLPYAMLVAELGSTFRDEGG